MTGPTVPVGSTREFLFSLLPSLLLLPCFSTLLLILRGDRRWGQVFNVVAWGLAAGIGLLIGASSHRRVFWMLWGIWLYITLTISALILEALTLGR
jgi:hypothetical protein